jgi:peptidoglycan/LPS O-acetylase OafA/YrhL
MGPSQDGGKRGRWLTLDALPLVFLGIGALLLVIAGGTYLAGNGGSTIVIAIGAMFVLVAIATAITPNK